MTKDLHKEFMKRARLWNIFLKDKTETNKKPYKTQNNFCKKPLKTNKKRKKKRKKQIWKSKKENNEKGNLISSD